MNNKLTVLAANDELTIVLVEPELGRDATTASSFTGRQHSSVSNPAALP